MYIASLPNPPTPSSLAEARREVTVQQASHSNLTTRIQAAEEELARVVEQSKRAIRELEKERAAIEQQLAQTLSYLSPIRRLPQELLGHIFMCIFDDLPCCAWILSAVSSLWRRQVLSMHKLWSKIRLVTSQSASAETVRLWLERSGSTVPLDIEIFLHSPAPGSGSTSGELSTIRRRSSSTGTLSVANGWDTWVDYPVPPSTPELMVSAPGYVHAYPPHFTGHGFHNTFGGMHHQDNVASSSANQQAQFEGSSPSGWRHSLQAPSRSTLHWGHIAFFYLTEQMHRWERFMFRYDRRFPSDEAMKSILGKAPLLREFEISCAEPGFLGIHHWKWLPSTTTTSTYELGNLTSLTLQYVPFKWSSPIFRNLQSLSLRSLPNSPHALDRILYMISSSPQLENLALYFSSVNPAVLPLSLTTLERVRVFSIGGHFLLTSLVDCLVLPSVETLVLEIDSREAVEDTLSGLLIRSNHPPVSRLSLSYNVATGPGGIVYTGGSMVNSWNFLGDIDQLRSLQVGASPLEPLMVALDAPEDEHDPWFCPNLVSLSLRACNAHPMDGLPKLVRMVEARNPDSAGGFVPLTIGGVTPAKLIQLELHDCPNLDLDSDVIRWLNGRIRDVACTEAAFDRCVYSLCSTHFSCQ
ncbi:hypothetical protein PHLCEN_2v12733 [Hermanssonia centrifuga]|uniref:F-box domain-containing protein n=1 Tax=Hermanssonia centrifuga TaxID=98765 RepID=A0A2R6NGI0_9APHY|nr:hypothetical protein PHLCEN_2v12733 [Hermanssonia centrifuga]